MRVPTKILSAIFCLAVPLALRADTLASFAASFAANTNPNYLGEKFLTGGTGTYNNLAFDFITTGGASYAIGTGFLLSQQYLGSPAALSSTTAGYLGSATAGGGFYTFANNLAIQSGTSYFFYENALAPVLTIAGGFTSSSNFEYFYAPNGGNFTAQPGASAAFNFTGSPVGGVAPTPEPSSFLLLATGLIGAAGALRRCGTSSCL